MSESQAATETEELSFDDLLVRVGGLVEEIEQQAGEDVQALVFELLDLLEAYHREGVTRLAMSVPPEALESAHEDPLVAHLLETYLGDEAEDSAPDAVVDEAIEEIRPYVHSHGGEMEVLSIDGGVVTLRLMGSCDGCPSSSATLTQGVESILRDRWPGFRELRVEGQDEEEAGHSHDSGEQLLQIQSLRRD